MSHTLLVLCECCFGEGVLYRATDYGELSRYDCTTCDGTGLMEVSYRDDRLEDDEDE